MKVFNLKRALAGEPVILENGLKAYVVVDTKDRHPEATNNYPLIGYSLKTNKDGEVSIARHSWSEYGVSDISSTENIAGMLEDYTYINGEIVPAPLDKNANYTEGDYYIIDFCEKDNVSKYFFYTDTPRFKTALQNGMIFNSRSKAKRTADALLKGIKQ